MSFKKYLENIIVTTTPGQIDNQAHPCEVPPEGIPMAGAKTIQHNVNPTVWDLADRDGTPFAVLNENTLKNILKEAGIIIKEGIINYDKINKIITFEVQDLVKGLGLEQLHFIEKILTMKPITQTVKIQPEYSRVIITLNPMMNIGGVNDDR